jgi:CRP/FNR family transcriptional regulator
VTSLARIEIVLFLRDVELFQYCTAEEVLRIAAIAGERRFAPGETLFDINDLSDALYCLLEGSVTLESANGQRSTIGPNDTFGVLDILSGRLRTTRAVAEEPTLTLAVEEEDFFDLLSNNIEIVRALFRQLTLPLAASRPETRLL